MTLPAGVLIVEQKFISISKVVRRFLTPILILTLIGSFAWTAMRAMKKQAAPEPPIRSLKGPQQAYVPFGFPISEKGQHGKFDPRMVFHGVFEKSQIPIASRFDFPMGTEAAGMTYNAQSFWAENKARGGFHTGDDINGIGGQNTDLGDAVYSIANGRVVYTGVPAKGWGNVVVVAHRDKQDRLLHSMYAHLKSIFVAKGSTVARGERLGSVGSAGGLYLAHLHLELHHSDGVQLARGYTKYKFDRMNPTEEIFALRGAEESNLGPSALIAKQRLSRQDRVLPELDQKAIDILSGLKGN